MAQSSNWPVTAPVPKQTNQPLAGHRATSKPKHGVQVFCRADYHVVTPAVAALARTEHIYKEQKFSDHTLVTADYDFSL